MNALVSQLRALGPVRLALLGGAALGVMGLLAWLVLRATVPPMALLYADLDPRDASQVVAALERARVPHRIEAGGSRILAPEDQVPRLRLTLAREGLPQGGSVGYEIFDRGESLTTTPFQQDVNRLRALEGEISRSIRQLAGVRGARVHLVLPRREAFSRERGDAQASVVLTMQGAQRLDREGVQAVLHLVATAVPGLRPQNISIVDNRGALLARGGQALAGPGAAQSQEEIRLGQQLRIARAVEEMLERTLGPGRVRAEATVEMDFDRVQTTEERFDPDNQVPRSQQSVQESSRNAEGGPATVQNNVPGQDPAGAAADRRKADRRRPPTSRSAAPRATRCANILWCAGSRWRCWWTGYGRQGRTAPPRPSASARRRRSRASPPWCAGPSASTNGAATRSKWSRSASPNRRRARRPNLACSTWRSAARRSRGCSKAACSRWSR